jgi:hypothetical protein
MKLLLSIAWVTIIACSVAFGQTSTDITMDDYNTFHQLLLRIRPIGFDLAGFITKPPAQAGAAAAVHTQECMIRLAGTYEDFSDQFSAMTTLVGLSAKMKDPQDRQLVIGVLGLNVSGFLSNTPLSTQMIDATTQTSNCSQDGATLAKAQEIKRLFKNAHGLTQILADRIGAKPLGQPR